LSPGSCGRHRGHGPEEDPRPAPGEAPLELHALAPAAPVQQLRRLAGWRAGAPTLERSAGVAGRQTRAERCCRVPRGVRRQRGVHAQAGGSGTPSAWEGERAAPAGCLHGLLRGEVLLRERAHLERGRGRLPPFSMFEPCIQSGTVLLTLRSRIAKLQASNVTRGCALRSRSRTSSGSTAAAAAAAM